MPNSLDIRQRFERRRLVRLACGVIFIGSAIAYLGWRTTIFNPDAPILSGLFFLAEVLGVITGITTLFLSSNYSHRSVAAAPENLRVDVLVTAYREPLDIVGRTVRAAVNIRYPHQTWLLDDGNRAELRLLASELGCRYLARERNLHAKAGNLNNALAHSTAEFFAVFDADHIPLPHALDHLLGFFKDPKVAFAQAPQDFFNTDSFQYMNSRRSGALWHDQSLFYNISLPCADAWNAASCVGTSVVYRRSAIDAIGGIPTETVTEDFHTSLRLHKAGFQSVYLNESIAYGVGAADLREYYKTRLRWGHGNVHALRHEKVLSCKGLSLAQRLASLAMGIIYLEGWQHAIMYLVPVFSLLTGVAPFEITLANVLIMIVYPLAAYLLLQEFACGFGRYWVNELYSMIRFPIYILSTLAVFRNRMAWRSSSKRLRGKIEISLMLPQLAVLALSIAALAVAGWRISADVKFGPISEFIVSFGSRWPDFFKIEEAGYNLDLLIIAGSWAIVNIVRVALFIRKVVRDARTSTDDYFFAAPLLLEFGGTRRDVANVERISLGGIHFATTGKLPPTGGRIEARLNMPSDSLALDLHVSPSRSRKRFAKIHWRYPEDEQRLADCLYSVDWHRELVQRHAYFQTPLEFLRLLFTGSGFQKKNNKWNPVLYSREAAGPFTYGLLTVESSAGHRAKFMAFEDLPPGELIYLNAGNPAETEGYAVRMRIGAARRRMPAGLDSASPIIYDASIEALAVEKLEPHAGLASEFLLKSAMNLRKNNAIAGAEQGNLT